MVYLATKRQKKEDAKRRIRDAVPNLPIPRFFPGPLRAANLVLEGAETLGQGLVEVDPLGIITDDVRRRPMQGPSKQRFLDETALMQSMVNDPEFKLTREQVDLINDDTRMVADTGMGLVEVPAIARVRTPRQARGPGQFDRSRILPRTRTRKKTKTDKNMSKALREANARLRTKNGRLRKGKTQADVMRLAHRLRRKM